MSSYIFTAEVELDIDQVMEEVTTADVVQYYMDANAIPELVETICRNADGSTEEFLQYTPLDELIHHLKGHNRLEDFLPCFTPHQLADYARKSAARDRDLKSWGYLAILKLLPVLTHSELRQLGRELVLSPYMDRVYSLMAGFYKGAAELKASGFLEATLELVLEAKEETCPQQPA